jgi:DNA-binding NtrC family response regulator
MVERLLIVDPDDKSNEALKRALVRDGFQIDSVATAEDALRLLEDVPYDLLIIEIDLPGVDGIELLRRLRERDPRQRCIIITAAATLDSALKALKARAADYLLKPLMHDELRQSIAHALGEAAVVVYGPEIAGAERAVAPAARILGESEPIREALEAARKVADSRSNILILGETGTGKELFARAIHYGSPRRKGPFVPINCSAIPEHLLESEFFGYERGAFTGAVTSKRGLFEAADNGTLFLDEIGDLSPALQAKLLRVIDDREIRPLGSVITKNVDIRFIAATNHDIVRLVREGFFREDLYYRLNVVVLKLPPLRARKIDVPTLATAFLERLSREIGKPVKQIHETVMTLLQKYDWPGNVRELQNIIERAVLLAEGQEIRPEHLPEELRKSQTENGTRQSESLSIESYTREFILKHQSTCGEQTLAQMLGITRKSLWEKRKKWGLKK